MTKLTCICCPRGCTLEVDDKLNVSGNSCPRGADYAIAELTHPTRTVTTSIRVNNREDTLVSVKTSCPIPKERMFDFMKFVDTLSVDAPTKIGDVVSHNPIDLECDILITKNID